MATKYPYPESSDPKKMQEWAAKLIQVLQRNEANTALSGSDIYTGMIVLYTGPSDGGLPLMTGPTSPPGYTATESSKFNDGYAAWRTRDGLITGDSGVRWCSSGNAPQWCQLTIPYPSKILEYSMRMNSVDTGQNPKTWQLLGSTDGVNFDVLDAQDLSSNPGASALLTYPLSATEFYTHLRINCTAVWGGSYRVSIAELDFEIQTSIAFPKDWLVCDGSVISQTDYPELFTVLGSQFNTGGEGAGNFRLPNYSVTIGGVPVKGLIKT